ncbi:MAG: MFS transporter [Thermoflexaceae bacterium]|nr:MFS transporter [Thermoflexaceae bacterium]
MLYADSMAAQHEGMAPPRAGGWRAAFSSLDHQQFRWLYGSNLAFFFAMNGQFVVRSILAHDLTGNATSLGLVNLMVALPMLIISPFGGVVADRFERRKLIMIGQATLLVNELIIFTLLVTGLLEFWHLLVVVFILGCTFPFVMPARQSIVANIVGREGLPNAMALQMGGMNAARVAAPVTAGLIVAFAGIRWMYLIATVLYCVALFSMTRVHKSPPPPRDETVSPLGELAVGFRYVAKTPPVRALMLLSIVPIMFAMPFQTLLVVFAEDVWKVGEDGFGVLQAFAGIGGILGSIFVAWHGGERHHLRMMVASLFAFAGTLFLFALSPWFLLALPLVLLTDVCASVFNTVNSTAVNMIIPDAVRGRVMSLMMMSFGLTPLGTMPVSAAADAWGAPAAVAGSAVAMAIISVLMLVAFRSLRDVERATAASHDGLSPFAAGAK